MAVNYKNSIYLSVTGAQTVPASANKTGTVTTQGKSVSGSGTSFLTQMPAGSWLCDIAAGEIRKVIRVDSNTVAYIEEPFTVDLSSVTPNVIIESDTRVVTISVAIPSGSPSGEIDNVALPGGVSVTFSKDSRDNSSTRDFIDPLILDGTGTTMLVTLNK